jgi:flagellin
MANFSVLNNIGSLDAQNQLNINNVNLNTTLEALSSGKRINSGADDPAGLEISDSLNANISALSQSVNNANNGISVAQMADGALSEITNLLNSAVTLASEAATQTTGQSGQNALQSEYASIEAEIAQIATSTNFNGQYLFTGALTNGAMSVFVGDMSNTNSTINIAFSTITADATNGTVSNLGGADLSGVDLTTGASGALITLQSALQAVDTMRGAIGDGMNQLQAEVNVLQTNVQNTQAAESTLTDADMASEISNLTKEQILAQSGMAALAQANSNSQNVLTLLKNG